MPFAVVASVELPYIGGYLSVDSLTVFVCLL
jgi:hypothetical protein